MLKMLGEIFYTAVAFWHQLAAVFLLVMMLVILAHVPWSGALMLQAAVVALFVALGILVIYWYIHRPTTKGSS